MFFKKIGILSRVAITALVLSLSVASPLQAIYAAENDGIAGSADTNDLTETFDTTEITEENTLFLNGETLEKFSDEPEEAETAEDNAIEEDTSDTTSETFVEKNYNENLDKDTYMGMTMKSDSDDTYVVNSKAASPRYNSYVYKNGLDVSHYQNSINWSAVRAAGYEFVFVKVSGTGTSTGKLDPDPNYRQNLAGAAAAGLAVGAYHYSQALNTSEAVNEANYICNLISGYSISMPVVMDYEWDASQRLANGGSYANRTSVCVAFCNTVKARGYTPCVYANDNCCKNYINAEALANSYKLWVARYSASFPSCNARVDFWQYSSSGSVPGISGRVDMDRWYNGTYVPASMLPVSSNPNYNYMYRCYNPNSGEHFYTANRAEVANITSAGWRYEGIGWSAPVNGGNVYRMYNRNAGDHHYTSSAAERDWLVTKGWKYEGIGWKTGGSNPLYRLYNRNAVSGSHHYTLSASERDWLVSLGWKYEGIGWYGG